jgi:hypothetical protein
MAMTMLDFELASDRLDYFSEINEIWFECTRFKRGMNQQEKEKIKNFSWFKIASMFSVSPVYKEIFFAKIRQLFSKIDEFLKKIFQGKTLEEVPLKNYIFGNKDILKIIMLATMEVYYNNYYPNEKVVKTLTAYQQKLSEIQSQIALISDTESEDYKIQNEKLQFFQNEKDIYDISAQIRVEYINYLIKQIKSPGAKRDSLEDFYEKLKETRLQFEGNLEEQLKFNLMYKRYTSANAQDTSIKSENSMSTYVKIMRDKRPSFRLDDDLRLLI